MSRASEIDYDWRLVMADRDKTSGGRRDVRDTDESEDFSSGRSGQQTVIPPGTGPKSRPGEQPVDKPTDQPRPQNEPQPQDPGVPEGPGKKP